MKSAIIPMVIVVLGEDVVGTDGLWAAGERRPVALSTAAKWLENGIALPDLPKRRKPLPAGAPEHAVILPYETPEG